MAKKKSRGLLDRIAIGLGAGSLVKGRERNEEALEFLEDQKKQEKDKEKKKTTSK